MAAYYKFVHKNGHVYTGESIQEILEDSINDLSKIYLRTCCSKLVMNNSDIITFPQLMAIEIMQHENGYKYSKYHGLIYCDEAIV